MSTRKALDRQKLMQWQVFNALAGCADGHAKNTSLLHDEDGGVRLSPFYDLICTQAIEGGRQPALQRIQRIVPKNCRVQLRDLK